MEGKRGAGEPGRLVCQDRAAGDGAGISKKKLEKERSLSERKLLIQPKSKLSIRQQCLLLSICRASFYYSPRQENADNLEMMLLMDAHILQEPTAGVLTMQSMLEDKGYKVGYERVRRLMRLANIRPIYPRKHLTQLGDRQYIYPYLLRNLKVKGKNQVWAIDITYVPMQKGFMYLTAIIDVFSRYIVGGACPIPRRQPPACRC